MPTSRIAQAIRLLVENAATVGAQEIRMQPVQGISAAGRYLIDGATVSAVGTARLALGQIVPVVYESGRPLVIFALEWQRGRGEVGQEPALGVVEELFLSEEVLYFRNAEQVTRLLGLADLGATPGSTFLKWGDRDDTFLLRYTKSGATTFAVYRLGRSEGQGFVGTASAQLVRVESLAAVQLLDFSASATLAGQFHTAFTYATSIVDWPHGPPYPPPGYKMIGSSTTTDENITISHPLSYTKTVRLNSDAMLVDAWLTKDLSIIVVAAWSTPSEMAGLLPTHNFTSVSEAEIHIYSSFEWYHFWTHTGYSIAAGTPQTRSRSLAATLGHAWLVNNTSQTILWGSASPSETVAWAGSLAFSAIAQSIPGGSMLIPVADPLPPLPTVPLPQQFYPVVYGGSSFPVLGTVTWASGSPGSYVNVPFAYASSKSESWSVNIERVLLAYATDGTIDMAATRLILRASRTGSGGSHALFHVNLQGQEQLAVLPWTQDSVLSPGSTIVTDAIARYALWRTSTVAAVGDPPGSLYLTDLLAKTRHTIAADAPFPAQPYNLVAGAYDAHQLVMLAPAFMLKRLEGQQKFIAAWDWASGAPTLHFEASTVNPDTLVIPGFPPEDPALATVKALKTLPTMIPTPTVWNTAYHVVNDPAVLAPLGRYKP